MPRFLPIRALVFFLFVFKLSYSQPPVFTGTLVSDSSGFYDIGQANTSKNVAVSPDGIIYVVYQGPTGVWVSKSEDRGASFLPGVQVSSAQNAESSIMVNDEGTVFVSFSSNGLMVSRSLDQGETFEPPRFIFSSNSRAVHMAHYNDNVYLTQTSGIDLIYNNNSGNGAYSSTPTGGAFVYADILTDVNGTIFLPTDDPNLYLFKSEDAGQTVNQITLAPAGSVFYSSYALSDGPCGTYIFTGGSGTEGYRLDLETGMTRTIQLSDNSNNVQGRTLFADNTGTLIDGYKSSSGQLEMKISADQGATFGEAVVIAVGESHNIARNPFTDDIVAVYSSNGQIYLSVFPDLLKNIRLNEFDTLPDFCDSNSFEVEFELSGGFTGQTLFEVLLSDAQGNFNNATVIGTSETSTSGTITCTIPDGVELSSDYRILIKADEICLQSNTIDLFIDNNLQITGDTTICEFETSQLSGSGTPSATNPWVSSDENVATIDNNGFVTAVSAGTTMITYTEQGGCNDSVTTTFTVLTQPVIMGPQTVCLDSQITYTANGTPAATDAWTSSDIAVATIDQNGQLSTLSSGSTTITYTTLAGCFDTMMIEVSTDATLSGDTLLCLGESSQLTTVSPSSITDLWQSSNPSVLTVDNTGLVTSLAPGTATVTFTNVNGCADDIDITVTDPIEITPINPVCENEQLQLSFTGGSSALSWTSSNPDVATVDENGLVSAILAGITTMTAIDDNGCSGEIQVTVESLPEFILPETVIVCTDDEGNVILETPFLESGLDSSSHTFEWYLNDELLPDETNSGLEVTFSGEYKLIATNNFTGCSFEDETIALRKEPPSLSVEITSIDFAEDQTIIATATGDGDFEYSIGDGLWQENGVFDNLDDGRYEVIVRDKNGCGEDVQVVFILSYPKFFTPNRDGFNDLWSIAGLQESQNPSINIFDRYGKLLKQLNFSDPSWDGTFQGELMPSSDYWFRINYIPRNDDVPRDFSAHFTLKR
ncbi:T9SS type B sorting domain-containing protein [Nonlabens sp. YIK11]|uniref:T9SS type B sorting domain-containing protein n=1 Tax=Nonlabens sp. YIK11 TaxID=1453349 RepID=UPI0012E12BF8|nr:T9SS type B sorting domain-containing protein [Nonlabens sp. YIK11]